jgi:uncharacterized protein (TIGR03435 family)
VGALVFARGVHALQSAADSPEPFEVASVKPSNSAMPDPLYSIRTLPDRFEAEHVTLIELIRFAYETVGGEPDSGPAWIRSDRFDIVAKVGGVDRQPAKPSSQRLMLRTLLSDRFSLLVHYDTRELPIFALTAQPTGKLGDGLKVSTTSCSEDDTTRPPSTGPIGCGTLLLPAGRLRAGSVTADQIARILSRLPDFHRVVINETRLNGKFDLDLRWTPEWVTNLAESFPSLRGAPRSRQDAGAIDPDGPSIFDAIKDQLGLKLESRRSPRQVLVIDSASRPSPN